MVHVRLNEKETSPNPHINFITPLTVMDPQAEEEARQLLRALAAQVRPIMKAEGFVVNSFEEYEHNQVFAGRNWNNGETVELVLRGAHGGFLSTSWLLSTLLHELAHIKHMNHGPAFQALWTKLRVDVRRLQTEGYYGDGFWSSGTRLADFARVGGQGLDSGDLPEYMCGGAQTRARPSSMKRRRRQPAGPSNHTGPQTMKKRKPGTRIRAKGAFTGSTGHALNEDIKDEQLKKVGTGYRKQAGSKRAREERALAAERRLLALQGQSTNTPATEEPSEDEDENEEDSDYEWVAETDQDRRHAMLGSAEKSDLDGLKAWQRDYSSDFIFPPVAPGSGSGSNSVLPAKPSSTQLSSHSRHKAEDEGQDLGVIELSSDEEDGPPRGCDVQLLPKGGTAAGSSTIPPSRKKQEFSAASHANPDKIQVGLEPWLQTSDGGAPVPTTKPQKLSGALAQEESGSNESRGLGGSDRERRDPAASRPVGDVCRKPPTPPIPNSKPLATAAPSSSRTAGLNRCWACQICTLLNEPEHLACSACATPRGQSTWAGNAG
ncbi:WLM-domain-containing protein [Ganoderma leucocontextum]|nr:WLM-domain-containing protein [Ganoderma leucocontextum]